MGIGESRSDEPSLTEDEDVISLPQERRLGERRSRQRGGRRAADAVGTASAARCPSCEEMANDVGESDGGWWFVCGCCDHLWNERERFENRPPAAMLRETQQSAS
jgi:hypothetical protein